MRVLKNAWKSLKGRFGVNAPRVAVRAHTPWYVRALTVTGILVTVAGASWATYHYGSEFSGFRKSEIEAEMKRLNELTVRQTEQIADMRQKLAASESQRKIDSGSFGDLAKQVKTLATENASLKDDLAFFQSLLPPSRGDDTLALGRLKVDPDAIPGEFRFRLLLMRGGQRQSDFVGRLQIVVSAVQGNDKIVLTLPVTDANGANANSEYQLNFKSFQRVEGSFKIAPGAVVKSIQVRVYQNGAGAPKLAQTVNMS